MTTTPARHGQPGPAVIALAETLMEGEPAPDWPQALTAARHLLDAQAAEVRAAVLDDHERRFLNFALDQAAEEMSLGDGFTDDDQAALASLRRMAAAARPDNTQGA